jgi:recombination protein RecR
MHGTYIDQATRILAKLPGLGPRSAKRVVLYALKRRDSVLRPLHAALGHVLDHTHTCSVCGNYDQTDPCGMCTDPTRDAHSLCVVTDVGDLWALERTGAFKGRYHVLGGVLSALDGIGPDELGLHKIVQRIAQDHISEVILALGSTVDGQTTAYVLHDMIEEQGIAQVFGLAQGIPMGGELEYLDEGTLLAALKSRKQM